MVTLLSSPELIMELRNNKQTKLYIKNGKKMKQIIEVNRINNFLRVHIEIYSIEYLLWMQRK